MGLVACVARAEKHTPMYAWATNSRPGYVPFLLFSAVYAAVTEHLARGNAFGIFPEGGSHDRPDLLPLKVCVRGEDERHESGRCPPVWERCRIT